jgi:hypothetical protein
MVKADSTYHTSDDDAARLDDLEGPICAAIDMAGLVVIAFDHASAASTPEGAFIRVDRQTWGLLGFAIRHQQELAKAVLVAFEARVDAP